MSDLRRGQQQQHTGDRSPPTPTPTTTTSGGQSSGQLSAPTPRRRPPPPPPPPRPFDSRIPTAHGLRWSPPPQAHSSGMAAPPPRLPSHLGSPLRPPSQWQTQLQTPPLIDENDAAKEKEKEAPSSTTTTSNSGSGNSTTPPAGEPSGSSSSRSGRWPITSGASYTGTANAAYNSQVPVAPRGILRTPSSPARSAGQGGSGGRSASGQQQSLQHSMSHPPAPSAHTVPALHHANTYSSPLRDAPTTTTTAMASVGGANGLRSRTRSRSPGALVGGAFANGGDGAMGGSSSGRGSGSGGRRRQNSNGGGGGGGRSVAISIDDSTGSGRVRHWRRVASLSSSDPNGGDGKHGKGGGGGGGGGGGDSGGKSGTKAALKRAAGATLKRSAGGDRLPLYHPNQRSRSSAQAYTNTQYQQQQHQHQHQHQGPAPVSLAPTWITHTAFLLLILYVMLDSKAKVDRSTAQLRYYREEESRVNAKIADFEERARQLAVETERLRRDNEALEELKAEQLARLAKLDDEEGMVAAIEKERTKMLHRDSIIRNQVQVLQGRIQIESRREATDKFGPGRHVVEVDLMFPERLPTHDEETGRPLPTKFHIEMASLADMPHTVQLFLEQVHHGLWDGCAFVWNPDHLVLASPHVHAEEVVDEDTGETRMEVFEDDDKREDFVESGYTSVSFQEYSPNFPHRQYTLGYAGRPGGPNFYINMQDNTRVHGPPQLNLTEDDEVDADPAFGKVVAGFDAVERLHALPTKTGGSGWQKDSFADDIIIRYAKILPQQAEEE